MNWPKRFREWRRALKVAHHAVPWWRMGLAILSGPVPRKVWRERMRYGCYQCPLFNKEFRTCRGAIPQLAHLGCSCYVPFSAMTAEPYAGGCWGRATIGDTFGWGAYVFPSRWARISAPVRFLLRR